MTNITTTTRRYPIATLSKRFGAFCLDLVFALVAEVIGIGLGSVFFALIGGMLTTPDFKTITLGVSLLGPTIMVFIIPIVVYILVGIHLTAYYGYTLGQKILHLKVVKVDQGTPIGVSASITRHSVLLAAWIIFTLPVVGIIALVSLIPMFDKSWKKQGWHDMFSGSVVLDLTPRETIVI